MAPLALGYRLESLPSVKGVLVLQAKPQCVWCLREHAVGKGSVVVTDWSQGQ